MVSDILKACIKKIVDTGEALTGVEALEAIRSIMKGEATPGQCGAFLIALKSVKLEPEVKIRARSDQRGTRMLCVRSIGCLLLAGSRGVR